MLVKDAMNKKIIVTKPDVTVRDIAKVMTRYRVGSLLVVSNQKLLGIVTELDIIWKIVANDMDPKTTLVQDIMTKKVITIKSDKTLEDATHLMVENEIKKLPVLKNNKLVGIITATDLISVQPKLIEALAKIMLFEEKKFEAG